MATGVGSTPPTMERVLLDIQRQLELSRAENQTIRQQMLGLTHRLDNLQNIGGHIGNPSRSGNQNYSGSSSGGVVSGTSLTAVNQLAIPLAAPERFAGDPQKLNIF